MSEIWLARGALDTELFLRDPELLKLHCQHADRRMADVERHDKMDEVFQYLLAQFESGDMVGEETHTFAQAAYVLLRAAARGGVRLGRVQRERAPVLVPPAPPGRLSPAPIFGCFRPNWGPRTAATTLKVRARPGPIKARPCARRRASWT